MLKLVTHAIPFQREYTNEKALQEPRNVSACCGVWHQKCPGGGVKDPVGIVGLVITIWQEIVVIAVD